VLPDHFSAADELLDASARNKRALLELLAEEAARRLPGAKDEILEALRAREVLGSTAFGKGIALPHALLPDGGGPMMLFARLRRPIDFDARDGEPVDLFFLVLWPPADPKGLLNAMSDIVRALRSPDVPHRLRAATTPEGLVEILRHAEVPDAGDHA
jgi:PTS system nitrogen regulatory IIA component